jgi:crotonobetainyl-CoA:carnitine CoA-transferase CaiB-like acyl-CoA transferase
MAARRGNRELVVAMISTVLAGASAAAWVERLSPLGIVAAQVQTLDLALTDALTDYRRMIVQLGNETSGLRAIGCPIKFDDFEPAYGLPPLLDEHRVSVLDRCR